MHILLVFTYTSWKIFLSVHKELHLFLVDIQAISSSVQQCFQPVIYPNVSQSFLHHGTRVEATASRGLLPPHPLTTLPALCRPKGILTWHI